MDDFMNRMGLGDPDPSNYKTGFDGADEIVDWFQRDKPDDWRAMRLMSNWYIEQLTNKNYLSPIGDNFLDKASKVSFLCQKVDFVYFRS